MITKQLKRATFSWDEENNKLIVEKPDGQIIELDKIYSFALMRFIIRIAQRNFLKNPLTKRLVEAELDDAEQEDIELEDPRQLKLNLNIQNEE